MKNRYITIPYKNKKESMPSTYNGMDSSSLRLELVKYALQFNGNPYVWGGTSLTKGADCSGFTQSVFKSQGISLPRTSKNQAKGGKMVPLNRLKPGDLIFYRKNGQVNHVAIFIGNEKVLHASNPKSGIKVSKYDYRKPYKAVSYFDI